MFIVASYIQVYILNHAVSDACLPAWSMFHNVNRKLAIIIYFIPSSVAVLLSV